MSMFVQGLPRLAKACLKSSPGVEQKMFWSNCTASGGCKARSSNQQSQECAPSSAEVCGLDLPCHCGWVEPLLANFGAPRFEINNLMPFESRLNAKFTVKGNCAILSPQPCTLFVGNFPRSNYEPRGNPTPATAAATLPGKTGVRAWECFRPCIHTFPNCYTSQLLDGGWLTWWCGWHDGGNANQDHRPVTRKIFNKTSFEIVIWGGVIKNLWWQIFMGWTSICQLFRGSLGRSQGFGPKPCIKSLWIGLPACSFWQVFTYAFFLLYILLYTCFQCICL